MVNKYYSRKKIPYQTLLDKRSEIADRFKLIYLERKNLFNGSNKFLIQEIDQYYQEKYQYTLTWWVKLMDELYKKPEIENLYQYWLTVYEKIKKIPSIHEQSKEYYKLTSHLNPGQMLQCDYYRVVQTFQNYRFHVVRFEEDLGKYCAGHSRNTRAIFKFVLIQKPWILKMYYSDNVACVVGNLKPYYIFNVEQEKEYEADNFFSYHTLSEDTPNVCADCLE